MMNTATQSVATLEQPAPFDPMRALALENQALILRLRAAQIPQHIGMAAASRALAVDLPRALVAQIGADLKSGVLAERWESAKEAAESSQAGGDPTLAAVAAILAEQTKIISRYLSVRGEEWASDAHRLEGQASALEAQSDRLMRATAAGSDSRPEASAEESAQGS
jgi:hypothetical protein